MEIRPKSTRNSPNRPTLTELRTLLTSLVRMCAKRAIHSAAKNAVDPRGAPRSLGDEEHAASG